MTNAALQSLGLNALESEVYTLLLTEAEPVTAYRIGRSLGKPTANVYKAIEALVRKGAVVTDESDRKLCRPVRAEEFLNHVQRSFSADVDRARAELSSLGEPPPDERVYQLESAALVFERARTMLDRAERIVVLEVFPAAAQRLKDAIQATIDRGVDVYLELYEPLEITGGEVVVPPNGSTSVEHWRSEQLNLSVDGREVLIGLLSRDLEQVHQALWTNSLYLSCLLYSGMLREHFFGQVGVLAASEPPDSPLNRLIEAHPVFYRIEVPGQLELFDRLEAGS